uniref:Distal membrane arm assembly component 2 n=1 Tax=Oreochromis niloticus TaxID=8128 RepID=I3KIJ3_ORENI
MYYVLWIGVPRPQTSTLIKQINETKNRTKCKTSKEELLMYVGQSEWFRTNQRGKFSWDFLNHKNTPIEEADMSYTIINYTGLENLERQRSLRTLKLKGCPEVDDWFLARLHMFQDSLEELDISHCPRITTGGLAALRNLK